MLTIPITRGEPKQREQNAQTFLHAGRIGRNSRQWDCEFTFSARPLRSDLDFP